MLKNRKESAIIWLATQEKELNRTVLNKLLFFIDTISLLERGKTITEDFYIKKPYGPVPRKAQNCREFLQRIGYINENLHDMGNYIEYGYKVVKNKVQQEQVEKEFDINELVIINNVLSKLSSYSASYLSEITHKYEPWKSGNWEEELDLSKTILDESFKSWLEKKELYSPQI